MKEDSLAARVSRASKRKLQTQQDVGDFSMGKVDEKDTTSQGKKPKTNEETDTHLDPYIKREFDEYEYYITSPVQTLVKQKKQSTG
jgi:hypothetical protein